MSVIDGKIIAIVGAGPAGLTLARLLQMHGIEVTVFERDSSRDFRNQGATLDLHQDSGLAALQAAGLMDAFRANYRPGADSLLIADEHAAILHVDPSNEGREFERPEIDRGPLRDLLIDSLHPGTVRWDHKLEGARETADGIELSFAGADTFAAHIAVGADGVNSRLRRMVTPIRPLYSGVTIVEGNIASAAESIPVIVEMLAGKHRAILALGSEASLAAGTKGDGSATFYCGLKRPESWAGNFHTDTSSAAGRVAWFHDTFPTWSPVWTPLFEHAGTLKIRPQFVCPFDQYWEAKTNVTLIGDSAHIMPPYAGEGVNMAMLDALTLARQLLGTEAKTVKTAIAEYQGEMFARTSAVARMTMENTEAFHSADAASRIVALFRGFELDRKASLSAN